MFNKLEWQREYRKKTKNKCTNKYEKTVNGFLMRKYRNMQSRVTGVQSKKAHLYKGLELLDRQEFYNWSNNDVDFQNLYRKWGKSGYTRKLCPTVNRIDSKKGYIHGNMEWITHSENSKLGSINRHKMYAK